MSELQDPGTGKKYWENAPRIINKAGSFSINRVGDSFSLRDLFQHLLSASWTKLLSLVLISYVFINAVFASIYYTDVSNLGGVLLNNSFVEKWLHCFYFSCQTFTTVGYGAMAPNSHFLSLVSAFEALLGYVSFALIAGLLYGRFSRPRPRIKFSEKAIIGDYKDGKALMFRLANARSNVLLDLKIRVLLHITDGIGTETNRRYHSLTTEIDQINFLPTSWTVVHPITKDSPLYKKDVTEFGKLRTEIIVVLQAFDDSYSETIYKTSSYTAREIVQAKKFAPAFETHKDGSNHFYIQKLDDILY